MMLGRIYISLTDTADRTASEAGARDGGRELGRTLQARAGKGATASCGGRLALLSEHDGRSRADRGAADAGRAG